MYASSTEIEKAINDKIPIVIDTSILYDYLKALFLTGQYEGDMDLAAIRNILPQLGEKYITPHVLAEISTLANKDFDEALWRQFLEKSKAVLLGLGEEEVKKEVLLQHEGFIKFGVCDTAVFIHSKDKKRCLLTKDDALYNYAISQGTNAISISQIRAHYLTYSKRQ